MTILNSKVTILLYDNYKKILYLRNLDKDFLCISSPIATLENASGHKVVVLSYWTNPASISVRDERYLPSNQLGTHAKLEIFMFSHT